MKKIYLFICITASFQAVSQIPKGSMFGGLTLSIANQKSAVERKRNNITEMDEPSYFKSYNIMPEFSYFIIDDLAIGAFVGFGGNSTERTRIETTPDREIVTLTKNSGPSFGIFARKFWKINDHLHTFAGLGLSMYRLDGTTTITTTPVVGPVIEFKSGSEYRRSEAALNFGLAYHLSESYMVIGSFSALQFYSETQRDDILVNSYDQTKNTGFDFTFNTRQVPFNLGFIYLLNGGFK